ncbi:MAG: hypothetical protein KOO60_01810 [Gemmatimonadales bacterium]|nr:hypothetical protein [Gemmatimonadales bacterium]
MIISGIISYSLYRLPLKQPVTTGGGRERSGLLIRLDGAVGEAAPLPGLHEEGLAELPIWLNQFELPSGLDDADCRTLLHQISAYPAFSVLPPSLRFGIESALVVRAAANRYLSLEEYLWPGKNQTTRSAALFSGSPAEARELLASGMLEDYDGVKIKVGRRSQEDDIRTVRLFRDYWPQGEIRLDANRNMDIEGVLALSRQVENLAVSFIEEPFAEAEEMEKYLTLSGGLPVALDESLIEAVAAGGCPARGPKIKAWVIKPSCLGMLPAIELIEAAGSVEAIVSSSFESDIGLKMLTALAAGSRALPGLGTDRWFPQKLDAEHLSAWVTLPVDSDG